MRRSLAWMLWVALLLASFGLAGAALWLIADNGLAGGKPMFVLLAGSLFCSVAAVHVERRFKLNGRK